GPHDAHGERMLMLREQRDLLAGIHQTSDRQNGMVFARERIEEDRISSVVNHPLTTGAAVRGTDRIEHPNSRRYQHAGITDSFSDDLPIALYPPAPIRFVPVHRLPPADQVPMRHDDTRYSNLQVTVAELVSMKDVRFQCVDASVGKRRT